MKFTKDEYIKLADRFNALPLTEQMQRVFDNPNVLSMRVTFKFKDITPRDGARIKRIR